MAIALSRTRSLSPMGMVRVVVRMTAMIILLLIAVPAYYLTGLVARRNPVPRLFLAAIAWLAGARLRFYGTKVRRGSLLLINHVSWLDIPAIAAATGSAFVGHDGLADIPLIRWLCRMNDTVFVARYDRTSVHAQVAEVRAAIRATGALAIFPEGTTSDGTGLLPFKSSLLSALEPLPEGIVVQPVLLDYGPEAAQIAWIGEEHGIDNFLRLLARRRKIEITVHFLPVLSGEQVANRKAIANAARDAILDALTA